LNVETDAVFRKVMFRSRVVLADVQYAYQFTWPSSFLYSIDLAAVVLS